MQVVRFTPNDRDRWFNEILENDDTALEERLLALPTVNPEFNVSSDTMNLSCVWLAHAIFISHRITEKDKHQAMIDVMLVLQYKFLTSRLFRHFKFPADPAVAEAAYAELSYKYAIKKHGNWLAALTARAEEIIAKVNDRERESIHYQTITKMDNDDDVIYMLNDTQGRIRDALKNIYGVFLRVHKEGGRIVSTSMLVEHDGESILLDKSKNLLAYGRYINAIVSDKNSFIREELTSLIEKIMHTMSPRFFMETLVWMSYNYRQSGAQVIEEILNETLIHSFDYLGHHRSALRNSHDLPGLISTLCGVYKASRSTDPALLSLREKVESVVRKATGSKNGGIVSSVRTGILLYIVLRTFTMQHYTANT